MRKPYVKPMIDVIEIDCCMMLSASVMVDTQSQGDFKADFVKGKKRGTWGNLWEENNESNEI